MIPRTEIEAIDIKDSIESLKNHFIESGNSKIIVYKGDIDHIVGFIHSSETDRLDQPYQGSTCSSGNHASTKAHEKIHATKKIIGCRSR